MNIKSISGAAAAIALSCASLTAGAGELLVQFTGLDLVYDSDENTIADAVSPLYIVGDPNESDPLLSMDFTYDGAFLGNLTTDIWADVFMELDGPIVEGVSGSSNITSGAFDLLTNTNPDGGWGLALDITGGEVAYTDTGSFDFVVGGGASTLFAQNLPFDLDLDDDIAVLFSFSLNSPEWLDADFSGSGTGEVTAQSTAGTTVVPEPASLALLGLGIAGLGFARRKAK